MNLYKASYRLMGSDFELAVVQPDKSGGKKFLELGMKEIQRIENLLSEFLPGSETSKLNQYDWNDPIPVNAECFNLIERCLAISKLTSGCFDITVSPLKKLYSFLNGSIEMPSSRKIQETLKDTGYQNIELHKSNLDIFFRNRNLRISFSAIGKGYAADAVMKLWKREGVQSGYVNASGDLSTFGSKPDGSKWKIGIADPDNPGRTLLFVPVSNASVATSGDYEQFFMYNNTKYSHNIDPRTGLPLTGIKSVSVFSPSAELSDALATAIYVMGKNRGIDFVNQLPKTHCIIIDENNLFHFSKHLKYEEADW